MLNTQSAPWREVYEGGSPEAERELFREMAQEMLIAQRANRARHGGPTMRTLHSKIVAGIRHAELCVATDLPGFLQVAHFTPGHRIAALVRFSNASGVPQSDAVPDMRGAAVRLSLPDGQHHDLLMTSLPVSHARNARQFVDFALIATGDRASMLERLVQKFGRQETERMMANIKQGMRPCISLALESFWSRGAVLWGEAGPVRFNIKPRNANPPVAIDTRDPNSLRLELAARLAREAVTYSFSVQCYVDEVNTPIEDGAIEWTEEVAPSREIATLVIPSQDLFAANSADLTEIDRLAFNPWNAPAQMRPLGNLNRARKYVYAASAAEWQAPP